MNPWFRMASDTAFMIWDAQQVMALRFMRLATGAPSAWQLENVAENVDTVPAPNRVAEIVEEKSAPTVVKKAVPKSHNRLKTSKSSPAKSRSKKRKSRSK